MAAGCEVDAVYQQQHDVLDAAELDMAGGHIAWTDYDDLDPELGWKASCGCGWECLEQAGALHPPQ